MAKRQKVKETGRKFKQRTIKPRSMDIGEVLEGRIISIVAGSLSDILTLVDDNGEIHRLWMSTVLSQAITQGDIMSFARIEYKGEVTSKSSGRPVHDYEIGIAPPDGA